MTISLRVKALVQAGHRVVIQDDALADGAEVDVYIVRRPSKGEDKRSILEIIESSPAIGRTPEEWAEFERQFQEDRDSWDHPSDSPEKE